MTSHHTNFFSAIKILRAGSELKIHIINHRDRFITACIPNYDRILIEFFKKLDK